MRNKDYNIKPGDIILDTPIEQPRMGRHYFKVTKVLDEPRKHWVDGEWVDVLELTLFGQMIMYRNYLPVKGLKTYTFFACNAKKLSREDLEDIKLELDSRKKKADIAINLVESLMNDFTA